MKNEIMLIEMARTRAVAKAVGEMRWRMLIHTFCVIEKSEMSLPTREYPIPASYTLPVVLACLLSHVFPRPCRLMGPRDEAHVCRVLGEGAEEGGGDTKEIEWHLYEQACQVK